MTEIGCAHILIQGVPPPPLNLAKVALGGGGHGERLVLEGILQPTAHSTAKHRPNQSAGWTSERTIQGLLTLKGACVAVMGAHARRLPLSPWMTMERFSIELGPDRGSRGSLNMRLPSWVTGREIAPATDTHHQARRHYFCCETPPLLLAARAGGLSSDGRTVPAAQVSNLTRGPVGPLLGARSTTTHA